MGILGDNTYLVELLWELEQVNTCKALRTMPAWFIMYMCQCNLGSNTWSKAETWSGPCCTPLIWLSGWFAKPSPDTVPLGGEGNMTRVISCTFNLTFMVVLDSRCSYSHLTNRKLRLRGKYFLWLLATKQWSQNPTICHFSLSWRILVVHDCLDTHQPGLLTKNVNTGHTQACSQGDLGFGWSLLSEFVTCFSHFIL